MYFKITREIINQAYNNNIQCIQLIKLLDWTILQGKHIVFAEKEELKNIVGLKTNDIISAELHGFNYVLSQYPTIGAIVDQLKWHAEFSMNAVSSRDLQTHTIYININDIPRFDVCKETHLLCENLADINFYRYVLKYYQKINNLSIRTNYYPILGGGSTTAKVYSAEINEKKALVLCFVDSDQKSPTGTLGDTARATQKVDKQKPFNAFLYVLNEVLEVENLIPLKIYNHYINTLHDDEAKRKIDCINELGHNNQQYLNFLDMKKGITLRTLIGTDTSVTYQQDIANHVCPDWAKKNNILDMEIQSIFKSPIFLHHTKIKPMVEKYLKSQESIVCGLGENILENVLANEIDSLNNIQREDLRSGQLIEYNNIGELLCNWTCCLDEVRS